jgi:hypothetical protein
MFAESNDTSKRYTVFFQADKAIIVGFRRVYERNAAPTLDNLQAALVQKYGPMTNSAGPMFHWAFNADGDLITDKSDQCYYRSLADDGPRAGPGDPRTDGFPAATGFTVGNRIGCAKTIFAWAGNGATTTWLIDGQVFTDANKAAEKADAEARAARQRAHEQVKPDL